MSRNIQDIKIEDIIFSKPKSKSQKSMNFLYVYSDKKSLVLKMPKMRLPFGAVKDTLSKKNQYIVDLSFEDNEELLNAFEKLDEFVISKIQGEYYKDKTFEEVSKMYVSSIKKPNNPNYEPTLRTKIVTQNGEQIKCDFYENEKNDEGKYPKINLDEKGGETYLVNVMGRNSHIESIIECIGVWMINDKFGLSYKMNQVKLYPKEIETCDFLESDSSSSTTNSDIDFLGE